MIAPEGGSVWAEKKNFLESNKFASVYKILVGERLREKDISGKYLPQTVAKGVGEIKKWEALVLTKNAIGKFDANSRPQRKS